MFDLIKYIFLTVFAVLFVLDLHMRWSLYVSILCVVCYRVIVAPYVRSVGHVLHTFTLLMTIRNALWTMRLLYSLKFFLKLEIDNFIMILNLAERNIIFITQRKMLMQESAEYNIISRAIK